MVVGIGIWKIFQFFFSCSIEIDKIVSRIYSINLMETSPSTRCHYYCLIIPIWMQQTAENDDVLQDGLSSDVTGGVRRGRCVDVLGSYTHCARIHIVCGLRSCAQWWRGDWRVGDRRPTRWRRRRRRRHHRYLAAAGRTTGGIGQSRPESRVYYRSRRLYTTSAKQSSLFC